MEEVRKHLPCYSFLKRNIRIFFLPCENFYPIKTQNDQSAILGVNVRSEKAQSAHPGTKPVAFSNRHVTYSNNEGCVVTKQRYNKMIRRGKMRNPHHLKRAIERVTSRKKVSRTVEINLFLSHRTFSE